MKNNAIFRVLTAMGLAFLIGMVTTPETQFFGFPLLRLYELMGQIFLNALSLVVVPLVVSSIIVGTSKIGEDQTFGKLGVKLLGLFLLFTASAVLTGSLFSYLVFPHMNMATHMLPETVTDIVIPMGTENITIFSTIETFLNQLIPSNLFAAAAGGQLLGLIAFSIVFGFFTSKLVGPIKQTFNHFWQGLFQVMMLITHFVMMALPFGVFGLMAKVFVTTGWEAAYSVIYFVATTLSALTFYGFVILPFYLWIFSGLSPFLYFRALFPALITAFSTSSTAATLPITFECVEEKVGVSNRISSLTLPLGASMNLTGSSLYAAVSVIFLAGIYGITLNISSIFLVFLLCVFGSFGLAGVPSAVIMLILIILDLLGIPKEGLALIFVVERFLDMFRTMINVWGNSIATGILATWNGEKLFPLKGKSK